MGGAANSRYVREHLVLPGGRISLVKELNSGDTTVGLSSSVYATGLWYGLQLLMSQAGDLLLEYGYADAGIAAAFAECASADSDTMLRSCIETALGVLASRGAEAGLYSSRKYLHGLSAGLKKVLIAADVGSFIQSVVAAAALYKTGDSVVLRNYGGPTPSTSHLLGSIARLADGRSWYVDQRGYRHEIRTGGVFECLAGQLIPVKAADQAQVDQFEPKEDAACVQAGPGNILRTPDGDSYLLNADWTRSWIATGGAFECLRAAGHTVVDGVPRYYIEDLAQAANTSFSCYDATAVRGKVVRASDGSSFYVDKRGGKHWIPDGGTFTCLDAQVGTWAHVVPRAWLTQPQYENAQCVRAVPGNIIRHANGDSYIVNGDWSRSAIPTIASYWCFRADHALVDNVPRYYIDDLTQAANAVIPSGNCIVRRADSAAYFVNNEGKREWLPDTPTWDCEVGRGVPVIAASDAFVNGLAETGWHYCLNKASLRGKVLRHTDGDSHYIHADDTRTWVPDEFTYNCRVRQGVQVATTRWREYVNAFRDTGWDYCFNLDTFRNTQVVHPEGDRHFVGGDGRRHWIPSDRAACMEARFGAPRTVRWREYVNAMSEGEWAICGDTLYRDQLMDRGQWLRSGDGRYTLHMQTDGNLVLYNSGGAAIWATGRIGRHLKLHGDGCLAEVDYSGNWVWQTGCNQGGDRLVVQSDGNLVLYAGSRAVWASSTAGR
jgi:hypothetical protein